MSRLDRTLAALTPEEQIQLFIEQVEALVGTGVLNQGQGNGLTTKLGTALHWLQEDNVAAAIRVLQALANQAQAIASGGNPSQAQAGPLIDVANAAIDQLLCT